MYTKRWVSKVEVIHSARVLTNKHGPHSVTKCLALTCYGALWHSFLFRLCWGRQAQQNFLKIANKVLVFRGEVCSGKLASVSDPLPTAKE